MRCLNFLQSSSSGPLTLVVRKTLAKAASGRALFTIYKIIATILWKTLDLSLSSFTASSLILNKSSGAAVAIL
jgi:hypothetical protein